jgi:anti-anti-sigma factor
MASPLSYDAADGPDPPSEDFEVQLLTMGNELLVRLEGELDVTVAPGFLAKVTGAIDSRDQRTVRLDLSGVRFMDSSGARALLTVRDAVAMAGGRLAVDGIVDERLPVAKYMDLHARLVADPSKGSSRGS